MRKKVMEIWPEIDWIQDAELREAVLLTWVKAFENSPLEPEDLLEIPFTLLVKDCPATFIGTQAVRGAYRQAGPPRR
jgi:hypothetical protein